MDEIKVDIIKSVITRLEREKHGCEKAGYKCLYVDSVKSLTRSTRNPDYICVVCNRKRIKTK
jgi:hypothetical protein